MVKAKKKALKITVAIVLSVFALILAGMIVLSVSGRCFTVGRCVVADSGSVFWIDEAGESVVMSCKNEDIFSGLTTGDKILILRNSAVAESFPGQVRIYSCIKLGDGEISDIPESTIEALKTLGYIE